jgi:hypothetical protein
MVALQDKVMVTQEMAEIARLMELLHMVAAAAAVIQQAVVDHQ